MMGVAGPLLWAIFGVGVLGSWLSVRSYLAK